MVFKRGIKLIITKTISEEVVIPKGLWKNVILNEKRMSVVRPQ